MKRCTYQFEGYTPTGDGRCVGVEGHWPDKPHCFDVKLAEEWGLQIFVTPRPGEAPADRPSDTEAYGK